jgi:hypothetical protein
VWRPQLLGYGIVTSKCSFDANPAEEMARTLSIATTTVIFNPSNLEPAL